MIGTEGQSTAWVNLRGYLVKSPPELVRHAIAEESVAEATVEEISRSTRSHLKGNEGQINFQDLEVDIGGKPDSSIKPSQLAMRQHRWSSRKAVRLNRV